MDRRSPKSSKPLNRKTKAKINLSNIFQHIISTLLTLLVVRWEYKLIFLGDLSSYENKNIHYQQFYLKNFLIPMLRCISG